MIDFAKEHTFKMTKGGQKMSEQSLKDIRKGAPASHLSREEQLLEYVLLVEDQNEAVIRLFDFCEKILATRNSP